MTSIGRCTESADWGRGLPLPRVITERNTSDARVRSAEKSSILWEFCLSAFCHASLVFGVAPCVCQMNNSDASEFWAPASSDALDFGSLRVLMH